MLSMAGLVYLLFFTRFYFTALGVFLLIVLQIVLLIQYVFHLLDDVFRFATALSQGDHSLNYPIEKKAGRLKELYHTFNKAILFQREIALQKEAAFHLFRTILEKVRFGVIVVQGNTLQERNRKTEILFMNEAATFFIGCTCF
jgi:nitrogen fixation/metabolism regulation signal transduction histidine kinase